MLLWITNFISISEPVPVKAPAHNPYAVARPHATASLLQRQGSLRGGPLNASPFKRQLSLRLNTMTEASSLSPSPTKNTNLAELISPTAITENIKTSTTTQRTRAQSFDLAAFDDDKSDTQPNSLLDLNLQKISVDPIESNQNNNKKSEDNGSAIIAAMCQQLSQGLSILSANADNGWSGTSNITKTNGHTNAPQDECKSKNNKSAALVNDDDIGMNFLVFVLFF